MVVVLDRSHYDYVLYKLFVRDPNHGGIRCFIVGDQGAGKTNLMCWLAWKICDIYGEDEVVIWRGHFSGQFSAFPKEIVVLHLPKWLRYRFLLLGRGRGAVRINPERRWQVRYYEQNHEELFYCLEPGKINVVYAPNDFWLDLLCWLPHRPSREWTSVFFDEIEDIAPSYVAGDEWKLVEDLAKSIKEYRKTLVSMYAATQQPVDVDYCVKYKLRQIRIYLKGAIVDGKERLTQEAVDNLELGRGYLCTGGNFSDFTIPPWPYKPLPLNIQPDPWIAPEVE